MITSSLRCLLGRFGSNNAVVGVAAADMRAQLSGLFLLAGDGVVGSVGNHWPGGGGGKQAAASSPLAPTPELGQQQAPETHGGMLLLSLCVRLGASLMSTGSSRATRS